MMDRHELVELKRIRVDALVLADRAAGVVDQMKTEVPENITLTTTAYVRSIEQDLRELATDLGELIAAQPPDPSP